MNRKKKFKVIKFSSISKEILKFSVQIRKIKNKKTHPLIFLKVNWRKGWVRWYDDETGTQLTQTMKQTSLTHRKEEEEEMPAASSQYSPKAPKHPSRPLPRSLNYLLREQRLLFILLGIFIGSIFFIIQPTLSRLGPPDTPSFISGSLTGPTRRDLSYGRVARVPVGIGSRRLRIVVTGGAGFVGSHLVDKLIGKGNEVIVIDNFFTGRKENLVHLFGNPRFELIRHDVVEPILLEVDQIYHLACPASPVHYKYNPVKTIISFFRNIDSHFIFSAVIFVKTNETTFGITFRQWLMQFKIMDNDVLNLINVYISNNR